MMYNSQNQVLPNNPYRFQAVGIVGTSSVGQNMPMVTRAIAAPLAPSQRQPGEWGLSFTGGDKKTMDMAEHVKLKVLPFYEVKKVVIKQRCLTPNRVVPGGAGKTMRLEAQLDFGLTFQDCNLIAGSKEIVRATNRIDYGHQLQLRFGVLSTQGDQDDEFPPSMVLKVNGKQVQLPAPIPSNYPGTPPRQPSKPLNITSQTKLRPIGLPGLQNHNNTISISWMQDIMNRQYVISLNLVKKLTSDDLFDKLKQKGNLQPTTTKKMIESIMKVDEDGMAPTSLKVSVACPVGKSRMVHPCRSSACPHIQCFDARLYLQMNEKKPVWSCPVCNKKILYDDLSIDGYFVDIIKVLPASSITDVEINSDGSWIPIEPKSDNESPAEAKRTAVSANGSDDVEMVSLDDSISGDSQSTGSKTSPPKDTQAQPKVIEMICLSDSDDDSPPTSSAKNPSAAVKRINPVSEPPVPSAPAIPAPPPAMPLPQLRSLNPPSLAAATPPPAVPPPVDDDDDVICLSD